MEVGGARLAVQLPPEQALSVNVRHLEMMVWLTEVLAEQLASVWNVSSSLSTAIVSHRSVIWVGNPVYRLRFPVGTEGTKAK